MPILTVDPLQPGLDDDSHFYSDDGYPIKPWLMVLVNGRPHMDSAEVKYNYAHASLRSVVEQCIGLLKTIFAAFSGIVSPTTHRNVLPVLLLDAQCCTTFVLKVAAVFLGGQHSPIDHASATVTSKEWTCAQVPDRATRADGCIDDVASLPFVTPPAWHRSSTTSCHVDAQALIKSLTPPLFTSGPGSSKPDGMLSNPFCFLIQVDYLRLAPCFKSLFVEGGKCSQKYKSMIQWSKASTDITEAANVEEGLRRTCCTFNEYVHCYYVHMPELCGEEGRDFFRTYTEKMSGPLIHEHCASYTFDSTCSCQAMAAPCRWAAAAAAYLLFIAAAMLV
ncbi:hypothetical protein HPB51_009335 [Rhipicephalus microplus]|uniref:DDE Tnp4 domain-containing protein n=1 Tax=Rhipicephalus microplus TaxID=6941 RepID=A0A9J6F0P3_RHIMP|nr:hypothetical protein HPB51_009335 [Rhipicephalus microplus]